MKNKLQLAVFNFKIWNLKNEMQPAVFNFGMRNLKNELQPAVFYIRIHKPEKQTATSSI